jgi:hypothetical protein
MFIKLSKKSVMSTIFILLSILFIYMISYFYNNLKTKRFNYEYLDNIPNDEQILQEYCNKKYICGETCNIIYLPPGISFDSHENVRDYIEDFFNIYLDVFNIGCINDKIKTYIGENLTMKKIFVEKNLSLNAFSPLTLALIDNLYFSDSPVIGETRLNKYAAFKLVKQRIDTILNGGEDYNLFYDNNFNMFMLNKKIAAEHIAEKIKPRVEEIYDSNSNTIRSIDRNEIIDTNECKDEVCKIPIKTLIGQDMIRKLGGTFDKVEELRNDLSSNIEVLKTLCEYSIVIDLFLKYYDVTDINNLITLLRNNSINISKYNELRNIMKNNIRSLTSSKFTIQEFKRLLSVDVAEND